MTLYLDTSALVKLYVEERDSSAVRRACDAAEVLATSRVAYPEARAALARRAREGGLGADELTHVVADLDHDWDRFVVVEVDAITARRAGELAERHALRGFDAVHLASALELRSLAGEAPSFACYDERLRAAALAEGLPLP
jgi:predicted nucleic acid-binding protein